MNKVGRVSTGLLVALAAVVFPVCSAAAPKTAAKPKPVAPAFSLTDLDGNKISLVEFKGKVVLLNFWATWCAPCQAEVPRFVEWQNKYRQQGCQVIGVSMDDAPDPVRNFYQKFNVNYPVAMGDETVAKAYGGILGLPVTFLIGRDGRVLAKYSGITDLASLEQEIVSVLKQSGGD